MIYCVGCEDIFNEDFKHVSIDFVCDWVSNVDSIAVDTETEGLFDFSNKVIMLQLGNKTDQFVIDCRTVDVRCLKSFFEGNKEKIFWNAKFDVNFLRFTFGWNIKSVYDCFLSECIITTGHMDRQLSLEAACLKYCNKQLNKETRNKFVGLKGASFTATQIQYGAEDIQFLHDIQSKQRVIFNEFDPDIQSLEDKTVLVLADIEYNGMKLDAGKWNKIANLTAQNSRDIENRLDKLVLANSKLKKWHVIQGDLFSDGRPEINYSSSQQNMQILTALGINVKSTNEKDLLKHAKSSEFVKTLLEYKKQNKLANSFGKNFLKYINPVTGRIHQSIWQILDTGRMSSREPNLKCWVPL